MANNESLSNAKEAKNDEFYTQYSDIEAEMNAYVEYNPDVFRDKTILLPCDDPEWSNFTKYFAANFERFGLKKLISTSYAKGAANKQPTLFELDSPLYDAEKHATHGKLFTLTHDTDGSGNVDTDDVEFSGYLEGDGDFRSSEVCKLRDEADIIITNPPFSLFREFLAWIMDGKKQFVILGNMNAITYKEVFPLLKENNVWLGYKSLNNDMYFNVTDEYKQWLLKHKKEGSAYKTIGGVVMGRLASACWFTNIDHGKRHKPLLLDTMAHNLKYNKKLIKKFRDEYGKVEYPHYDNYDAIEVPFVEAIPSDYLPDGNQTDRQTDRAEQSGRITESWACRLPSLTGSAQNNSKLSESQIDKTLQVSEQESIPKQTVRNSMISTPEVQSDSPQEKSDRCMHEFSSGRRCNGVMGVPITFMDKYNPDQFEILGATQRGCHDAVPDTRKYDDYWEVRQSGERTGSSGGKTNENGNIAMNDGRKNYFINTEGRIIQSVYQRIFIRRKIT